ncbi:hypothetical protein Tco_0420549 [Tanacetum coccineum]
MRADHDPVVLFRLRKSLTFLKAATSGANRPDAANFYQSRIIILTMGLLLKTATSAANRPETVIQNGNSKKRISTGKDGIVRILSPVTAAKIQAVEKERKVKNILLMAIPKEHMRRFLGWIMQKEIWKHIRTLKGLDKGDYDRFQQLLSQFGSHGAERASNIFSSAQNVAFVSQQQKSSNKVKSGFTSAYSTCTPSTSSTNIPEKEIPAGFADEAIYSLFAKQSMDGTCSEDLDKIDDLDIEEDGQLNWQIE